MLRRLIKLKRQTNSKMKLLRKLRLLKKFKLKLLKPKLNQQKTTNLQNLKKLTSKLKRRLLQIKDKPRN